MQKLSKCVEHYLHECWIFLTKVKDISSFSSNSIGKLKQCMIGSLKSKEHGTCYCMHDVMIRIDKLR